jgi:hypothetical protein
VELRRVLLLFALVLGLSALVASLAPAPSRNSKGRDEGAQDAAITPPGEPAAAQLLRFRSGARPATRRVAAGTRLAVDVQVSEPGDVQLGRLGIQQSADPLTPAHFDLLAPAEGRYDVIFDSVSAPSRLVGRIAVVRR